MISLEAIMARMEKYNRFDNLHPAVAAGARELIKRAYAEGIPVQITTGYRSNAESNQLYALGRTQAQLDKVGLSSIKAHPEEKIVSNARGGQSYHNYGLAIDFVILSDDGNDPIWTVNSRWRRVAAIGKSLGFSWGGDWSGKFKDYPHLEMAFGLSIHDLQNGKRPPANSLIKKKNYLEKGDSGEDVKNLQNLLLQVGYDIKVDSDFGQATEDDVRDFQKSKGLEVDGIAGAQTLAELKKAVPKKDPNAVPVAVVPFPGKPLKKGDSGIDVQRIQRALKLPADHIDSEYGPEVEKFVKSYQRAKNLPQTGVVDEVTWNTLF